ncbi:MAG TPA: aconitate hydratase AcnA [Candidatus Paceibacterota bacterium]|nr:aconitate hydratase AcnA [Verrucomicrobiota bacterium]HRZ47568.1 aconitate hydratase AcnA [Candidatus Paceibacterota bacterium]HRZ93629.1 aconitate hydratase AcnA [Candidatus Paceibacterota bacterium]
MTDHQPLTEINRIAEFDLGDGATGRLCSIQALRRAGFDRVHRLPVSLRIVLESLLRHCDGRRVTEANVRALAQWQPNAPRTEEVPFMVARIVLQDFTGVPLLVDLAAMRSAAQRAGKDPRVIEPLVPVDLVVDHSVQVDFAGRPDAFQRNLEIEFERNRERYELLKWGQQAFRSFRVIPPGIGIIHQVNLEHLAQGVIERDGLWFPDTLVGTDSHTTMINGLGIVGWGVGGIEAEAGMLGQPVCFLTPDVVGMRLAGRLRPGVTATDAALTVTQMLRRAKVVGRFVEFFGPGAAALPVVDRATIANMAPEYGATVGFFPIDAECVAFLRATGRSEELCRRCESYYRAQGLFGMPDRGDIDYSMELELDLGTVEPSVAGPRRPQDRIELRRLKPEFLEALRRPAAEGGFGKPAGEAGPPRITVDVGGSGQASIGHGSVAIAAITSCTNTSNPSLMLAAGLLARNAVRRGLRVSPAVKTSLAPGSRVVTDYLERTGLQPHLDALGFHRVAYGCTTCIGNSGPLAAPVEAAIVGHDLVAASVLSGNRNFEARVHPRIRANFLMSPPLVVAFALAGRVDIDLETEPLGWDPDGRPVFLRELWPDASEIDRLLACALEPEAFRRRYRDLAAQNPSWNAIPTRTGVVFAWDPRSTYVQEPPFFREFSGAAPGIAPIRGARALAIFGDSVTTDHISPAGPIDPSSPAGEHLRARGVAPADFNSYGARRGNDQVMIRGTFANVRIRNQMTPGVEGGFTVDPIRGGQASIFDAAAMHAVAGTPLIVIAGLEYGTGSSRDWAAKGTRLLGVRAVIARSFERIHRSNLVGMGVLPLEFQSDAAGQPQTAQSLRLDGGETYDLPDLRDPLEPRQELRLQIRRRDGRVDEILVRCRIDTPVEIEYYRHGGILPWVLRQRIA